MMKVLLRTPCPTGSGVGGINGLKDCSFDVVSEVDMQEVDNAVNQAKKSWDAL